MLIEDLNQRKNETLKSRIFGKLIRKRKQIREEKQNRNKEQTKRNKAKLGAKKHKRENEAKKINKNEAQPNEFDDVLTNYILERVAKRKGKNTACSLENELQRKDSLFVQLTN